MFPFFSYSISLIRNCEKLPAQDHFIVQEYLDKPFLMEGYKFDLRIYILVTSCDPLRIFLYNDGLVRMGTEKYHTPNESNLVRLPYVIQTERKQRYFVLPGILGRIIHFLEYIDIYIIGTYMKKLCEDHLDAIIF